MKHIWSIEGHEFLDHGERNDDFHRVCEKCGAVDYNGSRDDEECCESPLMYLATAMRNIQRLHRPSMFMNAEDLEEMRDALDVGHNTMVDLFGKDYDAMWRY